MSSSADFLVEIGTEELPPKALRSLSEAFAGGIADGLAAAGLASTGLSRFATPRRLAVVVTALDLEQSAQQIEKRGPPVKIAFDADGQPTRAAEAFAAGLDVPVASLERMVTPKGEWLVYRGQQPGRPARELLPGIVSQALDKLPVPKRMRWGAGSAEFVRPVHWVVMLLGREVIPAEILGCRAGAVTRGHRFHARAPIELDQPSGYASTLQDRGHVLADFEFRQARVAALAAEAARALGGEAVIEPNVLEEVAALVEWPVPVAGQFDQEFLDLPEEVLIATLQEHQRYFPVRGADGRLMPNFIAISNLESSDPGQVKSGNERVVRPRLADAAFFWKQDGRRKLVDRREDLRSVVFEKDLGSLYDKSARVARLCHSVAAALMHDQEFDQTVFQQWSVRAAHLAKTDLLTALVGEYPELQGRMGYYYARQDGEPVAVAQAIEEQYLPRHAGDRLPASATGRVLSLSDRLDTLAGIFTAGKRPSGNKDPYGLRRAALGLLRILIEDEVDLDLRAFVREAIALQPKAAVSPDELAGEVFEFVMDRLRAYYIDGQAPGLPAGAVTPELFDSVRARGPSAPLDFHQRLLAVHDFMTLDAADSLAQANKRIANILRSASGDTNSQIHTHLLTETAEIQLHRVLMTVADQHADRLAARDYAGILTALAGLRTAVDTFFDSVMVMTEDAEVRNNRLALLRALRELFLDVADLSLIPRT